VTVQSQQGFSKGIWDFFRSVRTTVFLLPSIVLMAVVGTLVPQGAPYEVYKSVYGAWLAKFFLGIGLDDTFHSGLFMILLTCLALNITACTWNRLPLILDRFARPVPAGRKESLVESVSFGVGRDGKPGALDLDDFIPRGWKPLADEKEIGNPDRIILLKGRAGLLAFPVIHFSLLIILFGGLVSSLFAVEGDLQLAEGESHSSFFARTGTGRLARRRLGFTLRCDSVKAERDKANEHIVQYVTHLSILENGRLVKKAVLSVNTPLDFGQWRFYQSEYNEFPGSSGRTTRVTGLRVARDPGADIVWTGCGLLIAGLLLVFIRRKALELTLEKGVITARVWGKAPEWNLEKEMKSVTMSLERSLGRKKTGNPDG